MDYLQYMSYIDLALQLGMCFKPYYKWITFNTQNAKALLSTTVSDGF